MRTLEDYEGLVKDCLDETDHVIISCESNAESFGDARARIDRELGDFRGFWLVIYREVALKLGMEAAKKLQERMLIHATKIENKKGFGFFSVVRYLIGHNIDMDEYKRIVTDAGVELPVELR